MKRQLLTATPKVYPTTMVSAKRYNFGFKRRRRRQRLIIDWCGLSIRPIVAMAAVSIIITVIQFFCCDFLMATSVSSASVFVTGFSVPITTTTRTTAASYTGIILNGNDITVRYHQQSLLKSRQLYPSEVLMQPWYNNRRFRRCELSMRLFGSKSFLDNENSSSSTAAVISEARGAKKKSTNSTSLSVDDDDAGEIKFDEKKKFLINPINDFASTTISDKDDDYSDYKRGLLTIGFITLLFSTKSPVLHWAFTSGGDHPPPVLLVNSAVSVVALVGLLLGGDTLENTSTGTLPIDDDSCQISKEDKNNAGCLGGLELGTWKFLGLTSNLYGLSMTTAAHGALLTQLTTLIVPTIRALVYKDPISTKLKISISLALSGVVCFASDPTGTPSLLGDALCVVAAICYSINDLRLYEYGKVVGNAVKPLVTTKIATQAFFSTSLLLLAPSSSSSILFSRTAESPSSSWQESSDYMQTLVASSSSDERFLSVVAAVLWAGLVVNAVAPFLQVRGQQILGPTKCQTIYASQPLWAAILSFVFLGERLGSSGIVGGTAFLIALGLASTAETTTTTTTTTDVPPQT